MFDLLVQAPGRRAGRSFVSTLRHLGAAGLFFLAIIDSSPLPTFGGPDIVTAILAASRRDLWYEYAASATVGSLIGAYFTFRIARKAGSAYLDRKFKKGKLAKFLDLFKKWGTGTLLASTMIPLPTPTSMFFAAAGAFDFPQSRFVAIVAVSRVMRYFGIAFIAATYGRHFLRILRHPIQHWGWMVGFIVVTVVLVVGGILINRRLTPAPAK
jgi:membrane protein YqaA with SNARE-associated domain